MIISFWSTHHGQCASTTSMISIGTCLAFQYKMKVLFASARSVDEGVKQPLISHYKKVGNFDKKDDLGDLMRLARNGLLQPNSIANYTTPILKGGRLDLLADAAFDEDNTTSLNSEVNVFKRILEMAKDTYDVILVDVHSGTKKDYIDDFLKESTQIVLSVNQNLTVLMRLKTLIEAGVFKGPPIICVGKYQKASKMTLRQINKFLNAKMTFGIAYNTQMIDVINEGNVLEYFGRYFYNGKFDKKNHFFESVLDASNKLLKATHLMK